MKQITAQTNEVRKKQAAKQEKRAGRRWPDIMQPRARRLIDVVISDVSVRVVGSTLLLDT